MDALLEHDPKRAAKLVASIRKDAITMDATPEFENVLKEVPATVRERFVKSLNALTATLPLPAGPLDGADFAKVLPDYKGWTPAWDFPGFLAFQRGDLSVFCTPDYNHPGTIAIDVQRDGTSIGDHKELVWPMAKRTPASFMKLMRPVLDAASKHA